MSFSYAYSDSNIVSQVLSHVKNIVKDQQFTDIVTVRLSIKNKIVHHWSNGCIRKVQVDPSTVEVLPIFWRNHEVHLYISMGFNSKS